MVLLNPKSSQPAQFDHQMQALNGFSDATNSINKTTDWPFSFGKDDFMLLIGQQLDQLGYR